MTARIVSLQNSPIISLNLKISWSLQTSPNYIRQIHCYHYTFQTRKTKIKSSNFPSTKQPYFILYTLRVFFHLHNILAYCSKKAVWHVGHLTALRFDSTARVSVSIQIFTLLLRLTSSRLLHFSLRSRAIAADNSIRCLGADFRMELQFLGWFQNQGPLYLICST